MNYYPTDPYGFLWNYHFEREEELNKDEEYENNPPENNEGEFD